MRRGIAVVVVVLAGPAAAQQPNPNQQKADQYFAEGRELLVEKQDAKGACEKFRQAIELDPTAPGVMLNLGLCYEMQEKFATSLYWFRKAQFAASETKPPLTEYEDAAKEHTQTLATKVALAKIDVSQAPPGVRVTVDGRPVDSAEYLRLEVDADSVIEARAPGKEPFRQQVEVTGREAKNIVIVMTDEIIPPMHDPGKGRRRLAYIVGAGGVLLWGVTLTYGLVVRGRYEDTTDGHYDDAGGFDDAKRDLRYVGTSLFAAGSIAVGAAIVLYVTAPKAYRERREQAFVPMVSPDHVGLGYAASF